jgi:NitT/TauT family transport system substrate-binding protein
MSIKRFVSVATLGVLLGGVLAACSDWSEKPLRVALNPWPGYAFLFLAQEKRYFTEEGVNVELVELPSLTDVRMAFERGQVDGMATSLVEVLEVSHSAGRQAKICVMADFSNGADVILADDQFVDLPALAGARIGIEPGTLNRFILTRALNAHGLTFSDVEIVNLAQPSMHRALSDGAVDAVVTYPPVSTEIERAAGVRKVFSSAEIPGEIADVISFSEETVSQRRIEIEAFVRAWGRAVDFARENPAEAYALIGPHVGMAPEDLQEAYKTIHVVTAAMQSRFFEPDGPLPSAVRSLNEVLWQDETALTEAELDMLFVSRNERSVWAAAWN